MKPAPLPKSTLRRLRARFERRRKDPWAGHKGTVKPKLLPFRFGDGRQFVMLSFYACPELCVVVPFDSKLPLDIDLMERCKDSPTVRCFRDALDEIYELCDELLVLPERIEREFRDDENGPDAWWVIIKDGSTWSLA